MTRKRKIMILSACLLYWLILRPLGAQATLITIQIEAVVDSVWDEGNYLEGQIGPGDIITGTYTYDTDTPDTNPSLYVGDYRQDSGGCGISLTVGGFDFRTDPSNMDFNIEIINDSTSGGLLDAYGVLSGGNVDLYNGTTVDHISWWLEDSSATALSSTELLVMAPALSLWQSKNWLRLDGERGLYIIDAHVTSAIPEPGTLLLLSFVGLFLRKRW